MAARKNAARPSQIGDMAVPRAIINCDWLEAAWRWPMDAKADIKMSDDSASVFKS